jgi:hypothetical protein
MIAVGGLSPRYELKQSPEDVDAFLNDERFLFHHRNLTGFPSSVKASRRSWPA